MCRLARLVEDSGDGDLVLSDYSDAMDAKHGGGDASHRVLVLDELSDLRPMFARDPGLIAKSSHGWTAVVAMLPRGAAVEAFVHACLKAGLGSCAECRQEACMAGGGGLHRICMCCVAE